MPNHYGHSHNGSKLKRKPAVTKYREGQYHHDSDAVSKEEFKRFDRIFAMNKPDPQTAKGEVDVHNAYSMLKSKKYNWTNKEIRESLGYKKHPNNEYPKEDNKSFRAYVKKRYPK